MAKARIHGKRTCRVCGMEYHPPFPNAPLCEKCVSNIGLNKGFVPEVRVSPEPYIGWRFFCLDFGYEDSTLMTIKRGYFWSEHKLIYQAKCYKCSLKSMQRCHCGIYSFNSIESPEFKYMSEIYPITGEIWIWGRIVKHKLGYRSQYASIKSLWYNKNRLDLDNVITIEDLKLKYKVPVRSTADLGSYYYSQHPKPIDPDSIPDYFPFNE